MKIDVLEGGGFVRLVDSMGSDLSVVRAARVSYNADWRSGTEEKSDERLIAYLMRNHHTSPFEAVTFTFEIKAPLYIFRQWHRHRTWSYNEISARYTELDEGFYIPKPEHIGKQSATNRQSRNLPVDPFADRWVHGFMTDAMKGAHDKYKRLLEHGVPRELARSVLPLAAYSRMFATVDLHNLMHFLRLRMHAHSQWEIQQYANALCDLAGSVCPVSIREFRKSLEVSNA